MLALFLLAIPASNGCEALHHSNQLSAAPLISRDIVLDLMAEHDIPGMAVAVSYEGNDHFYNFGVLDRDSGEAVTQHTLFEIGSISKVFTATLAAQAEQEGVISLETSIGEYLSELEGTSLGTIPVFHLATHTAGGFPLQLPDHIDTRAALYEYFQEWNPECPTGSQRHYANPSIGLLGILVARAKESDFTELMERELFSNLGMNSTFIDVPNHAFDNYAWGHNRKGKKVRVSPALLADEAYGVKTTSADLLKFLKLNLESAERSGPLMHAVRRTHDARFQAAHFQQALIWERYGYPLDLVELKSGNAYKVILEATPVVEVDPLASDDSAFALSKTGSTGGFGAYVLVVPEEDLALLLLANRNYPNSARVETGYRLITEVLASGPREPAHRN